MSALNANAVGNLESFQGAGAAYQPGTNDGTTLVPGQRFSPVGNTASETAAKHQPDSFQEGFSDFFEAAAAEIHPGSTVEPDQNQSGTEPEPVLNLKEAVDFYKISEKTIRLYIKDGKIPARKEEGPRGLEWRIYPKGLPKDIPTCETSALEPELVQTGSDVSETITTMEEDSTIVESERYQTGTTPEPAWYTDAKIIGASQVSVQPSFAPELKSLLDVITKQAEKLEAASMRIGYLEARTENYEKEIKLLTDSQHRRSWWARLGGWLVGQK